MIGHSRAERYAVAMTQPEDASMDDLRLSLMAFAENLAPVRELIHGEVAYFVRQGFTQEQARAIAATEFITLFGQRIENASSRPDD
jgi:hypothetical protein